MSVDVINMSFSMKPGPYDRNNATIANIKKLIYEGITVIVAAGNYGPLIDTLSPLAVVPGVISVGAASIDGKILADFSSRGIPGDRTYYPTVVAPGIDILIKGDKPNDNKYNQSLNIFKKYLYELHGEDREVKEIKGIKYYYPFSGTSASCSVVCAIAGRIIQMRQRLNLSFDPGIIKEIIIEIAQPMPGYKLYEIGAGYISPAIAKKYFEYLDNCTIMIDKSKWGSNPNLSNLWHICQG